MNVFEAGYIEYDLNNVVTKQYFIPNWWERFIHFRRRLFFQWFGVVYAFWHHTYPVEAAWCGKMRFASPLALHFPPHYFKYVREPLLRPLLHTSHQVGIMVGGTTNTNKNNYFSPLCTSTSTSTCRCYNIDDIYHEARERTERFFPWFSKEKIASS